MYLKCQDAVEQKTNGLGQSDVEQALVRIFSQRIETGEFDQAETVSYRQIGLSHFNTSAARRLALQTARESLVLLKNIAPTKGRGDGRATADGTMTLPVSASMKVLATGPGLTNDMLGDYHGTPPVHITFEQGLRSFVSNDSLTIERGCAVNDGDKSQIPAAVAAAKTADVILLYLGLDGTIENEGQDRPIDVGLGLPGQQESLLTQVVAAAKPGAHIAVVLVAGGPVDMTLARDHPKIGAILWVGYPGQAGGLATAETIFGLNNPGGRYPMTVYPKEYNTSISFYEMSMRKPPGRSYKWYTGEPV